MVNVNIVVVGSCMMDFVSYTPRLPQPGETIHGTKFVTTFGGKGANQCVAAAKLGGHTALVAKVGDDVWSDKYIDNLKLENVSTAHVEKAANTSTGIAQISVSDLGENQIVIVAGANTFLSASDVDKAEYLIKKADVLVLQLETSEDVAIRALELCSGISILNGAPALKNYNPLLLTLPTIFCVNETEAAIFSGLPVTNIKESEHAARALILKGCQSVIITLGAQGALFMKKDDLETVYVSCPSVKCVDSTGAGDAFIGALAFLLAERKEMSMRQILECSCYIASDCVTRPGTQISFSNVDILNRCLV